MPTTLKLDLIDLSNNNKITNKVSLTEFNQYLKRREIGEHDGTVIYFNDGSIEVDAPDYKNHWIKGTAKKVVI